MDNIEEQELVKLFNSPVKDIRKENNVTVITFENGKEIPLYDGGYEIKINAPKCSFCNKQALKDTDYLFTINEDCYICVDCCALALETFLKNGADVKLNISDSFPNIAEQIKKMTDNINNN